MIISLKGEEKRKLEQEDGIKFFLNINTVTQSGKKEINKKLGFQKFNQRMKNLCSKNCFW